jgi:DNA-binding LytR/AlgR family response regulator
MNCVITDKENSKLLEEFVLKSSSLNLIGTFSDTASVKTLLSKRHDIDLLFLDAEMPEMGAFNFISSLSHVPNIIMISSGNQNALKAFDFDVVDYLLKPLTYSRFCKAVDKAIRYYTRKEISSPVDSEIFIKKGSSLIKVKHKDIVYIEALENYVTLNTKTTKFTIHFTMKAIESQLPSGMFFRVHRSFIVNKSMIKTIKESSLEVVVGEELRSIPLGNSFRDPLLNNINVMAR